MPESTIGIKNPMFAVGAAVLMLLWPAPGHSSLGQALGVATEDAGVDKKDQISRAESAAKAGAETAEGKKFGEALGQAFGREHGSTIQRCAKEVKRPDLSDFDLFLRLNGTGLVDQAFAKPPSALATCVRDKMPGWKISAPPHAGFWVKVDVKLKSK